MPTPPITFYFDLGSPFAYLAAERLHTLLPEPVQWQPVLLGGLFRLTGRSSWALGDYQRRQAGMADIERRALALRPAADALAGPVAGRLPDRDARDHVRVLRRARARLHDAGLPRRVPARIGAERRRERAAVGGTRGPRSGRGPRGDERPARSSRRCAMPRTRRTIGACSACPRSRSATSCSGAMTGSRTPPPICRPPATVFDPRTLAGADRPGAPRRRPVDARARGRGVRGGRPRVPRGRLPDARRGARSRLTRSARSPTGRSESTSSCRAEPPTRRLQAYLRRIEPRPRARRRRRSAALRRRRLGGEARARR